MKYNDNGTYKDIYVKTFDTLPVGTEVDYDGETVPTGWTEVPSANIITIYLSTRASITISSSFSLTKIPLNNEYLKIGDKLTFDSTNNCVVIGAGVNHVKVSGTAVMDSFNVTSLKERVFVLSKNTAWTIQSNLAEALPVYSVRTFSITPSIISVQEDDTISLKFSSEASGETMNAVGTTGLKTYLTVEVID